MAAAAGSELDKMMNVVNPEGERVNAGKSRVRRKSKDLEDMMLDIVAPDRKSAFDVRHRRHPLRLFGRVVSGGCQASRRVCLASLSLSGVCLRRLASRVCLASPSLSLSQLSSKLARTRAGCDGGRHQGVADLEDQGGDRRGGGRRARRF